MTWNGDAPLRGNRREWTAYERARDGAGFDYDGWSEMTSRSLWPGTVEDVEDLTILSGIGDDPGDGDP